MKHLLLQETNYIAIHAAFGDYLKTKGFKVGTQKQLPSHVREFLYKLEEQGIHDLRWIEPQHIQKHYQYLSGRKNHKFSGGLSSSMLNHHIYALRTFFAWLVNIESIEVNPISAMDFPRAHYPRRIAMDKADVLQLFAVAETYRDKAMLSIYYGCGLRRSEGQDLNRSDIDFAHNKLIVRAGKFSKRREVPMHPMISEHLKRYWQFERQSYVKRHTTDNMKAFLLNNSGNRMMGAIANNRIQALAEKAALTTKVTLHVLRHSIATHLKENGMRLEQIQDFLGHSTLDTTQAYIEGYRLNYKRFKHKYF